MPQNLNEGIISKELADLNDLKVGDKIALGSEREAFMITRKGGKI